MKPVLLACIIISLCMLTGCSSIYSTVTGNDGIQEDPTDRTFGTFLDDERIETNININMNAEGLGDFNIEVVSYNGIVLLVGQVPTQELKNLATRVATSTTSQVRLVHNELEVAGDTTFLARSNDMWISTKIKSLMYADDNVNGTEIKVITENGVVYLMGMISRDHADRAVNLVSRTGGVVKVVRAFEYLD